MALTHNQINKLWFNPSYIAFKKSNLVKQIFTSREAEDFIRTGAFLIYEAKKLSNVLIPWDQNRRFEILNYPRLENAFISLGGEYFLKGIYLQKGYAINKLLPSINVQHPVLLKGNKAKLDQCEVQEYGYIVTHSPKIIDFTEYDKAQAADEKNAKAELKGQRLQGIMRMTIPYPKAKKMLDYLQFKRNYALHRPFIVPEFRGITQQTFRFFDYVATQATGKSIKELAALNGS